MVNRSSKKVRYKYPPANGKTVCNIARACLENPKFYYQVCHLMNAFNLMPPFLPNDDSQNYTVDSMFLESITTPTDLLLPSNEGKSYNEDKNDSEESEIECESNYAATSKDNCLPTVGDIKGFKRQRKKLKVGILGEIKMKPKKTNFYGGITSSTDSFGFNQKEEEEPRSSLIKSTFLLEPVPIKINIHSEKLTSLPTELPAKLPLTREINENGKEKEKNFQESQGFGFITPKISTGPLGEINIEDESWINCLITDEDIKNNLLSTSELINIAAYKNYSTGLPSCRLYLKNLSKKVTDHQLKCIYGRYINLDSESDRNMFHVQLFKTGRFRNQAFISLPNEETSTLALTETNGYVIDGKPLIVSFARSTKPTAAAD